MSADAAAADDNLTSQSGTQHIIIENLTSAGTSTIDGDGEQIGEGFSDTSLICQVSFICLTVPFKSKLNKSSVTRI